VRPAGLDSQTVRLSRFEEDRNLKVNLIAVKKANDTKAPLTKLPSPVWIHDGKNRKHYCTHRVVVRWWETGVAQSFSAEFYISNHCPTNVDAIVSAQVYENFRSREPQDPNCRPVKAPVATKGEQTLQSTESSLHQNRGLGLGEALLHLHSQYCGN
jgi:hypothetical protein